MGLEAAPCKHGGRGKENTGPVGVVTADVHKAAKGTGLAVRGEEDACQHGPAAALVEVAVTGKCLTDLGLDTDMQAGCMTDMLTRASCTTQ